MKILNEFEKHVLLEKGTELPFSGEYNDFFEHGIYVCKMCETPLFTSDSKFSGHCGWPSFDSSIGNNVKEVLDQDGMRTEIICANCGAHLGHVFRGEGFTMKNTRHCVNSISLIFIPKDKLNHSLRTDYNL
ncbi:methionine-R-sulfoxide reductase [Helicobacter trogontum]|uniref:methionine-R-sulfoxide reductase n=1 Tax=Helicobacter trogontum TaxID=50960 RepID=UPI000CF0D916|nr:methionine-R-sulfoxide reductase [Helicobacter trogontum]